MYEIMISFCHGQEHQAEQHIHIISISANLKEFAKLLTNDPIQELSDGMRLESTLHDHSINSWILTPDFSADSGVRRLLRNADIVLLHYTQGAVDRIEHYIERFTNNLDNVPIISVVDDFKLLEEMNEFHGTLTTSHGLDDTIHSTIISS